MFNNINLVRNDNLNAIEPYQSCYDVDISSENREVASTEAVVIRDYLCSREYSKKLTSHVFQYKIGKKGDLISILCVFFRCLLKEPIKLCCSPQYGTGLWHEILGFHSTPSISLIKTPEYFFEDYVSETTTFVRFHTDYYYNDLFNGDFRLKLARNCIEELLYVAKQHKQLELIYHALEYVLQLQRFQ